MSAFDKIFMLCVIHNTTIEELEANLGLEEIYNRYGEEEMVNLYELERMSLYFNVPISFFFLKEVEIEKEVINWTELMIRRILREVGHWETYKVSEEYYDYDLALAPFNDFYHEFIYKTDSCVKLKFIVDAKRREDKFIYSYALGYQHENGDFIEYPYVDNYKALYKELLEYTEGYTI